MVFEQPHPFPNKSPHYQNILRKCGTCRRATSLANTSPPELHSTLLVSVSASSWALFMWTPHMFKNTNFEMETSGPRKRILAFSYNLHKIYTDDTAQSILHITSLIQNHSQIKPTQMQIQFLQMQCDQSIWIYIHRNTVSRNWWVSSKVQRDQSKLQDALSKLQSGLLKLVGFLEMQSYLSTHSIFQRNRQRGSSPGADRSKPTGWSDQSKDAHVHHL